MGPTVSIFHLKTQGITHKVKMKINCMFDVLLALKLSLLLIPVPIHVLFYNLIPSYCIHEKLYSTLRSLNNVSDFDYPRKKPRTSSADHCHFTNSF